MKIVQEKNAWSTDELNKLQKRTTRNLRVVLQNDIATNWDSYREFQRQYKKTLRRANVDIWRRFC